MLRKIRSANDLDIKICERKNLECAIFCRFVRGFDHDCAIGLWAQGWMIRVICGKVSWEVGREMCGPTEPKEKLWTPWLSEIHKPRRMNALPRQNHMNELIGMLRLRVAS